MIGIWKEEKFFFETEKNSVKGRNLLDNPAIVVHVQDGSDVVIIEGVAQREASGEELESLRTHYYQKYEYKPDWSEESGQVVYRVTPEVVHAWKSPHRNRNRVKFLF